MRTPFEDFGYRLWGDVLQLGHRHQNENSYEIIQVLSGGGNAFLADRTYPLLPGTVLFIDASDLHAVMPSDVEGYCRNKAVLDGRYLRALFEAMRASEALEAFFAGRGGVCVCLGADQAQRLDRLFQKMARTLEKPPDAQRTVQLHAYLLELFAVCGQYSEPVAPHAQDRLAPVLAYLRTHYERALTVEQIAQETHLSKYYLCHLFHEQTGMTVMQYLYEYRLSVARAQLLFSDAPISVIAQNCGFSSSSHFSKLFRRREGLSPRAYRKRAAS
jgi:AraC-like DNA-binding protein